jgi:hypothetical protein
LFNLGRLVEVSGVSVEVGAKVEVEIEAEV